VLQMEMYYVIESTSGCRSRWLFLRIYKLECILLHNTFPSATAFSFYVFTFLMFRKLNKPQLTKIKQQNCIGIRVFDSCLYLDISRSFKWKESSIFRYSKVFQVSQMFTCGLSDLLSCGRFVVCFCIARIFVRSEDKLCQIWNNCIVSCIYWSIAFLSKLLIFFLTKLTIKSYIY
jgi:hypothetical protein